MVAADFHALGLRRAAARSPPPRPGLPRLHRGACSQGCEPDTRAAPRTPRPIRVAIIGRPERRQVHADQPPARRGARDRDRSARHHARQHPGAVRARRPRIPADRHRRACAAARASRMRSRSSASSRRCRRSRARTWSIVVLDAHDNVGEQDASVLGHGARARPRAPDRRQQMGRHPHGAARPDPHASSTLQARLRAVSRRCISSRRGTAPASASWCATRSAVTTPRCATCRRRS